MLASIELLNTNGLNNEIEKMFKNEQDFIFILSPYMDLTLEMQAILATSPAKVVILYCEIKEKNYRSQEKKDKIAGYKKSIPNAKFFEIPDFHSKAYITSDTLIIASLNLYKFSQKNNFELGVILKEALYAKIIKKIYKEIEIIFHKYKLPIEFLDGFKIISDNLKTIYIDDLFEEIQKKNGKYENDFADKVLLKQFSEQMMKKYKFDRKDRWETDENMLQRHAKINQHMYKWALENIKL
jgi:phosphatidylserine/phosphatidylglycerophosphate/cardiolipin synthase-like enzyme